MATNFRGYPACTCLVEWLPAYEAELQRRGILEGPLGIYQLNGNAAASAGTHKGGAFDTKTINDDALWVARQMGADATWTRTEAQGFMLHDHGVLRGCPHNEAARYQIAAVDDGYNGLGRNGRGGKDDGPRPLSRRTWREGIEWAKQQEEDMALSEEDVQRIAKAVWAETIPTDDTTKPRLVKNAIKKLYDRAFPKEA